MSSIRNLGNPTLPPTTSATSTATASSAAGSAQAPGVVLDSNDSTERVRATDTTASAAATSLTAPTPPATTLDEEQTRGALSFSSQLMQIGGPAGSNENLVAQFLKLQIEGQSMYNTNEALEEFAKHTMLASAAANTKSSILTTAADLRAQASTYATQATDILNQAGVDLDLAESCYDQAEAAGQTEMEALAAYTEQRTATVGAGQAAKEQAAILAAAPAAAMADELATRAGALEGNYASGLGATQTIRAGTIGLQTLLKNAEAQQEIANDFQGVLIGKDGHVKKARDAWVEVDEHRNEVAKLVLDLIDKRETASAAKSTHLRS